MPKKRAAKKRDIFGEIMEGIEAFKAHREGRLTLRTHEVTASALPSLEIRRSVTKQMARDQRWFHHPEMQRRIRKAETDVAEGRTHVTHSVEEAQALLDGFKSKRSRGRR